MVAQHWWTNAGRSKKLTWGTAASLLVSDSPETYNCEQCIFHKKQNRVRGRECLLERDYQRAPIPYSFKFRNKPEVKGVVRSEEDFFQAIEKALLAYETDDLEVALRRIGKGVCPKSFPLSRQSLYFLDIYRLTHGGQTGTELQQLPNSGSVLEQPFLFYWASDIIGSERGKYLSKKMESAKSATKDTVYREPDTKGGFRGAGRFEDGSPK